jgi:hypothetical protein
MSKIKRRSSKLSRLRAALTRREALKAGALAAGAAGLGNLVPGAARAQGMGQPAEKLLFVFTATGGGSIVDSFMAVREGEASSTSLATDLMCFPDSMVSAFGGVQGGGLSDPTALRALSLPTDWKHHVVYGLTGNGFDQATFLQRHAADTAVMTVEGTSVNHLVAQTRAVNGFGVAGGKTLGELHAERYGQDLNLPNVNMGVSGYLQPGDDVSLPDYARGITVGQPLTFALGTDGARGIVGAPGAQAGAAPQLGAESDRMRLLMDRARAVRGDLEESSTFGQTFQCSPLREKWLADQQKGMAMEADDLVSQLMFILESDGVPLSTYGLEASDDAFAVRTIIEASPTGGAPKSLFTDPFHQQVALAYLLTRYGHTSAITVGPSFSTDISVIADNPPLSFDFSHNNHVAAQSVMWSRVLDAVDKLIALLKTTPTPDGGTMYDRSLIYIASDFGRDKQKTAPALFSSFSTVDDPGNPNDLPPIQNSGHHLNNGAVMISPLLNGGRVYGGIDPDTLLTYGFDRTTGAAAPGTVMREGDVYSAVAQALGIDFPGRVDIPTMVAGG